VWYESFSPRQEKEIGMKTHVCTGSVAGTPSTAATAILEQIRQADPESDPVLVAIFASPSLPLVDLVPPLALALPRTVVISASTAGELTEAGDTKGAVAFFALRGDFLVEAGLGRGLGKDVRKAVSEAIGDGVGKTEGYEDRVSILLLDALSGRGEEAVLVAATLLGDAKLVGGAAGDDLAMAAAFVGLGTEIAQDAVVLATIWSHNPFGVGISHGHEPHSVPLTVTDAEGSVVRTIDGMPAWEAWKLHAGSLARDQGFPEFAAMSPSDETSFLLRYEAGLAAGSEVTVRAPLSRTADGALHFACGIPQGSVIRITESTPESQIASALEAARRARVDLGGRPVAGALIFDCICRNLILGDRFGAVAVAMSRELGGVPIAGFESYGEIALDAGDLSGFHNTTTVVLAFS